MPVKLMSQPVRPGQEGGAVQIDSEIRCAITGRSLRPDEAYWAPPLVTVRDLVTTVWKALTTAPGSLGQMLMGEQPNVPYAPEARQELARRRSVEQIKLLGLLLLIAAALIVPIMVLVR
jgi:hypothetical protein